MVWRLDRLGRSVPDLIALVRRMEKTGVELRSLTGEVDTSTPKGRLTFHAFGALAEFERARVARTPEPEYADLARVRLADLGLRAGKRLNSGPDLPGGSVTTNA